MKSVSALYAAASIMIQCLKEYKSLRHVETNSN